MLAVLTLRANQIVSIDSLIDELWEERPPRSATTTTQTYIYQLRKLFAGFDPYANPEELLATRPPGYTLAVPKEQIDATMFVDMVRRGRRQLEDGQPHLAARTLREALSLWSGTALADVTHGPLLQSYLTHLEEMRFTALELRIAADMRLGRHRELIAELKFLTVEHPLNEWMHAQLITALNASGRRGEALGTYQELRRQLNSELGLEPSAELQRLQQTVLTTGIAAVGPGRAPLTR